MRFAAPRSQTRCVSTMSAAVRISRPCGAFPASPKPFLSPLMERARPHCSPATAQSLPGEPPLHPLASERDRIIRGGGAVPAPPARPASAPAERRRCVRVLPVSAVRWPAPRAGGSGVCRAPPSPGRAVPDASGRHRSVFRPSASSAVAAACRPSAQGAGRPATGRDRPPPNASPFKPPLAPMHAPVAFAGYYAHTLIRDSVQ